MKLEILSFNWKLFKNRNVFSVTVMTKKWEITVLDNHISLITSLKPWVVEIVYFDENNDKKEEYFAIWWWILEVSQSSMKILIDMLIWIDEVDINLAEKAKLEAIEIMEKYKNSKDKIDMEKFIEAQDMLLKSVAQLKLWSLR